MKRTIMFAVIVMMIMLVIVPAASAVPKTWVGNVTYSTNGTRVPYDTIDPPAEYSWTLWSKNLNESGLFNEWTLDTSKYLYWNAQVTMDIDTDDRYISVNCTSPDGLWYGESAVAKLADIKGIYGLYIMDFVVYEQPLPFTKDLALGWNLVSLPRTPDDGSVSAVLASIAGKYDSVMKYTPATGFDEVTTMDPGVGYFIHMTEAETWSYDGYAYESMSVSLSPGLNMVGWVNSDTSLPDALDSIDGSYRYVARWNTTEQKYEVYDPIAPDGFNDFDTMEGGVGYFIAVTAGCTLVYSS